MSSGIVICRLCAESKHNSKQIDLVCDMEKRDEVIKHLVRLNSIIDFNDDKLPNTVCCDCICILNKCCDFVVSVESAQKVLHDLFYKRIPTRIKLPDDKIFFENTGLDDCDFCDSECGSIESQDAATPNTDDDISLADLVTCNPDSSVGSIPLTSRSRIQETSSDDFFLGDFTENNPVSSIGLKVPITSNPEVSSDGIQPGDSGLNISDPSVNAPDAIIPLRSLASNPEPSISSDISIADSVNIILIEGLGSYKTGTIVDSDKPLKAISTNSEAQSDDIPIKALKSKNLDSSGSSGKPKEKKSKVKTYYGKKIHITDTNLPAEQIKAWEDYNWLCTFCETVFPTIDELCTHSMEVHSICNPYRCTKCKLRHQRLKPFVEHITRHMKQLGLTCFKCATKFEDREKAKKHVKIHLTKLSCPGCYTTFKNSKALKIHEDSFLKMKYIRDKKNPMIAEDGMTCTVCSRTYTNITGLRKHLLTHERKKREYVCDICGKNYFEKNHLTYHMGTHTNDRPFKCKVCNRGFRRRNILKEHVWMHNDKPFPCGKCDKIFKLEKQLKGHQAVHTDVLPFECEECHKRFRVKCTLTRHMRVHTGEKPFVCKYCKKTFRNRSNLTTHALDMHNVNITKERNSSKTVETKATKKWKTEMMERKLPKRT